MMAKHGGEVDGPEVKWALLRNPLAFLRRFVRLLRLNALSCSVSRPSRYRRMRGCISDGDVGSTPRLALTGAVADSDLVLVKISLLGDRSVGKTSFTTKYVGDGEEQSGSDMGGLNVMEKMFSVRGASIKHSIWDIRGDRQFRHHLPIACKDSLAILFMFDLTNRCSLTNVIGWYRQARTWNKTAVPILIGTKFDDFIKLPVDMQWTVVTQARTFARALNATLFFSSATHNINVNKIFKFVTARIFNLPSTVERNLTLGQPIIDF